MRKINKLMKNVETQKKNLTIARQNLSQSKRDLKRELVFRCNDINIQLAKNTFKYKGDVITEIKVYVDNITLFRGGREVLDLLYSEFNINEFLSMFDKISNKPYFESIPTRLYI